MKKLLLVLVIAATFLPIGVAKATPPISCSGEFAPISSTPLAPPQIVDGNTIIVTYNVFALTGCFEGIMAGVGRIVIHPNGKFNFHAFREFNGTIDDGAGNLLSGTAYLSQTGQGDMTSTFTSHATILSGTGDLQGLRGEGTSEGITAQNAGTYTFHLHWEP
jgi:hypothetical protein